VGWPRALGQAPWAIIACSTNHPRRREAVINQEKKIFIIQEQKTLCYACFFLEANAAISAQWAS